MKEPVIPDQGALPPMNTGVMDRINFAIHFEKYRDILIKRWWIVATCFGLGLLYGGYKNFRQPDIFEARGRMMLGLKTNAKVGEKAAEETTLLMGTQIQLMQSAQVQEAVRARLADFEKTLPHPPSTSLTVFQVKNASIFTLVATSTSPEYAKRYLEQLMLEFIAYKKRIREESSESVEGTLFHEQERLDMERKKAQAELFEFQKKNNMAFYEAQKDLAAQYLIDLKRRLADVKTDLELLNTESPEQTVDRKSSELLSETSKGEKGTTNQTSSTVATPTNLKLLSDSPGIKNAITLLKFERDSISKYLRPKHPKIIRLNEDIERKQQLLEISMQQTKEQIVSYRDSLGNRRDALEKSIQEWDKQALEATGKAAQYEELKANLTRAQEFHELVRKSSKEVNLGTQTDQDMVVISDHASVSMVPIGPKRTKDLIVSALFGLLAAGVIIFLLDRFDDRVRTLDDLQDAVQETVLGQIPLMAQENSDSPLIMLDLPPQNTFSESFRNVRSSLMFSPLGGKARTIAVTSAIPGDGKTTCSVNLAICLAQIEGGRTLLIDADMRKMNVHRYFKMENRRGLSEVLSGQATSAECIVPTSLPNLDLLCAGSSPPNPGELILSDRFKALIDELSQRYQRVVIDTPPILATDDTLSLAPSVDGVVFIVKANQTSLRFVSMSMASLKQRGAKIFGLVLNHIDTSSAHHYYYYYYSNYYHAASNRHSSSKGSRAGTTGSAATISNKVV